MNGEWVHSLVEIAGVLVPVILYLRSNARKAIHEREEMHKENQRKFNDLISEREWLPPHAHTEITGPLTAEGIRFRRRSTD